MTHVTTNFSSHLGQFVQDFSHERHYIDLGLSYTPQLRIGIQTT